MPVYVYSDSRDEGFSWLLLTCWLASNVGQYFPPDQCLSHLRQSQGLNYVVTSHFFTQATNLFKVLMYWLVLRHSSYKILCVPCVLTVFHGYVHCVCAVWRPMALVASLLLARPAQDPVLDWRCDRPGHAGEGSFLLWIPKHQIPRSLQLVL